MANAPTNSKPQATRAHLTVVRAQEEENFNFARKWLSKGLLVLCL